MSEQEVVDFTTKYIEDVLAFFGVNITVDIELDSEGTIQASIPSSDANSILIGRGAETLRSMQYLLSMALKARSGERYRVNLDIADYKKQRAEKVADQAREWIEGVRRTGDSYIANLNAADRRIVHQLAGEYDDIETFSEGEGRDRHIIIAQKSS